MKKILIGVCFVFFHQSFALQNPSFGIFLLKDSSINAYKAARFNLQDLILKDSPLWGIEDFQAYECSNHVFELTNQAKLKIPEGQLKGVPFVFVANNSKIYLGAFWTSFSSFPFENPVIDVDLFRITGILKIDRAYPHDGFAVGIDPRASPEIIKEFMAHNILKESCP